MKQGSLLSVGLFGRLLAILLLTLALELFASTILYERSSRTLIRDDEAHRLAEHLVIARKLLSERPWAERPALASRLTTDRYDVHWAGASPPRPVLGIPQGKAWQRVVEWEPSLRDSDLHVQLTAVGRQAQLFGALKLRDATWIRFRAIEPYAEAQPGWHRILLAVLPAAVLLMVSSLLFGWTLRPMRMLVRASGRVGKGDTSLPEAGPAEVRRLIRAFNTMQARIHRLIADRTQALAAVGHDLRTPLARMQLRTDAIADPGLRKAFEADVGEMEAMVGSVLSYLAGDEDPEPLSRSDVAVMAATIVDNASDQGGDVDYVGDDHLDASIRPISMKRAIGNLVENALHYGQRARVSVFADGAWLIIRVDDDGPGIPEDRLEEVLHPFSRLDPARSRNTTGIGLGLAIVQRTADAHEGKIVLSNRPEGGLRADLRVPLNSLSPSGERAGERGQK